MAATNRHPSRPTVPIDIGGPRRPEAIPEFSESSLNDNSDVASVSSTTSADDGFLPLVAGPAACRDCQRLRLACEVKDDHRGCVACRLHGRACVFERPLHMRKRKLGHAMQSDANAKRSPHSYDHRRERLEQNLVTSATNSLIEGIANIGHANLSKRTLGLQNDRYSQHIGPTTDFEPSLIDLSPFNPEDETFVSRGTLRKVSDTATFLLLPDHATQGYEHISDDADAIEALVRPNGPKLVDLYFEIIHPSFPILQKVIFLEKYRRSYRDISPACLAVIYILAINWWDHHPKLQGQPKPNLTDLERLARVTLADAMFRPKLSTVQAGLLLSQRPEGDQWAPTAQLVAIAQELGLHLDCTDWKIPPWERGLRKRLAWALFMQDKWGALIHGRPSHIYPANWAAPTISQQDFPAVVAESDSTEDAIEVERGRRLFISMVSLSQILAEVLDTFYTLQARARITAAGSGGPQLVLHLAKPIQLKLKNWFAGLPASCRMESSSSSTVSLSSMNANKFSPVGSLHLHYYATEITLHRCIIRAFSKAVASSPTPPLTRSQSETTIHSRLYNTHGGGSSAAAVDPYIMHICRSAAKTRLISSMDFVNRLHASHLKAFWYFASKTNFALIGTFGSLLWATAPGKEEAEWYARRLGEYRWTLGVSGKGMMGTTSPVMGGHAKEATSPRGSSSDVRRGGGHPNQAGQASADPAPSSSSSTVPTPPNGLTAFAMTMLDLSTSLLSRLPEKPTLHDAEMLLGGRGGGGGGGGNGSTSGKPGAGTSFREMHVEGAGAGAVAASSFSDVHSLLGREGPVGVGINGDRDDDPMAGTGPPRLDAIGAARARTEQVLKEQGVVDGGRRRGYGRGLGMLARGDDDDYEEEEEDDDDDDDDDDMHEEGDGEEDFDEEDDGDGPVHGGDELHMEDVATGARGAQGYQGWIAQEERGHQQWYHQHGPGRVDDPSAAAAAAAGGRGDEGRGAEIEMRDVGRGHGGG